MAIISVCIEPTVGKTPATKKWLKHVTVKFEFSYLENKASFGQNFAKWRSCHSIFEMFGSIDSFMAADFIGLSLSIKSLEKKAEKHL